MNKTILFGGGAILVAAIAGFVFMVLPSSPSGSSASSENPIVVPELSQLALSGEIAFNENCAACHGKNAAGTDQGPPLIHKIYEPSHHGDFAFASAAKIGVRAHHWKFGDMPPVEGISDAKIRWIVAYVREIQRANGIN